MTEECWIFITDPGKWLSCFCLKAVLGIGPDCWGKNLWLNLLERQCHLWNGSNKTRVKLCGNVYHAWHRASVEYMAAFIIISSKMLNKLLLFARSYARGQECSAERFKTKFAGLWLLGRKLLEQLFQIQLVHVSPWRFTWSPVLNWCRILCMCFLMFSLCVALLLYRIGKKYNSCP